MREQDSERETRLGGIRPLAHDHDERPSREDKAYGGSIFDIPVPLPRFLRSSGRLRRWAERRRERQRHAAETAARAKRTRHEDSARAARHGNVRSGEPGPFGG